MNIDRGIYRNSLDVMEVLALVLVIGLVLAVNIGSDIARWIKQKI